MTKAGLAKYLESMARSILFNTIVYVFLFVIVVQAGLLWAVAVSTMGSSVIAHLMYRERLAWETCSACDTIHGPGDHAGLTQDQESALRMRRPIFVDAPPFHGVHGTMSCAHCGWSLLLFCGEISCMSPHPPSPDSITEARTAFQAHRCEDHVPEIMPGGFPG